MKVFRHLILLLLCALFLAACNYPQPDSAEPCGSKRLVRDLLQQNDLSNWSGWINDLSGTRPIILDGQSHIITSRFSYALFSGQPNARAFDYVLALANSWVRTQQIEVVPYPYKDAERTYTWKNLVVTLPGTTKPDEIVYLTAHLDSIITHDGNPMSLAPGADDNASGDATLLEGIRLLRGYQFERTIKIVFFTGEEQFESGSRQFVSSYPLGKVIGDINLDMLAYNVNDRIIQLHTGKLPQSQQLSNCFIQASQAYHLNIIPLTLTNNASERSDQASFWGKNEPAIWVFDGLDSSLANPKNPNYHRPVDTISSLNLDFGFNVNKAALATTASLALPVRKCFYQQIDLQLKTTPGKVTLHWNALPGAVEYRILRSETGCDRGWNLLATVTNTNWEDPSTPSGKTYHYRVEAIAGPQAGHCVSLDQVCQKFTP